MANATFFTPIDMSDTRTAAGVITRQDPTVIRIQDSTTAPTLVQEYYGNFTFAAGLLTAGTLTGFSEAVAPNTTTQSVTDINVDAPTFYELLGSANVDALQSFFYSRNDTFTGSTGNDVIRAYAGNDRITGRAGNDSIDGGLGVDTAVFSGARAGYTVAPAGTGYTVTGTDGADTLSSIERLEFGDRKFALDLGIGQSAGNTVRLVGAVAGTSYITPDVVRAGLDIFDAGATMAQVASVLLNHPVWLGIAGGRSNENFVTGVYRNVADRLPTPQEIAEGVQFLQGSGGSLTQAELLVIVANSQVNANHINITGLQQGGVEFI